MAVETNLTELTAVIVACFVSNNPLAAIEVPALITSTHAALRGLDAIRSGAACAEKPAVPIEQSVAHDYLICLNDGQKLRALKRYIQRKYALSPEEYREKWGLPEDYPMVAPAYSELRSKIAREQVSGAPGRSLTKKRGDTQGVSPVPTAFAPHRGDKDAQSSGAKFHGGRDSSSQPGNNDT